jgi:triosephosphate isomerase (TIM)
VKPEVMVGAQNVSAKGPGAFTGEVSADHFMDYGIPYVLIGHSDRRHKLDEG